MHPIRLGVLGCADVAARRMLPAVAASEGIHLAAVASRSAEKARAMADRFGGDAVTGYSALLDRDDIDAVYVPLPSGLHAEWVERALVAGKDVLAEKPLTTSSADTTRLVELASARGLVLMENFTFVAHTQHTAVRELLDSGAIGTVLAFGATFAIPPRPPGDIRLDPALGGGSLFDTGGYPLRAALHFLGTGLSLAGASLDHGAAVDLGGAALLARDDGVTAQLTFGLRHAYSSGYWFLGTKGQLAVDHVFTTPATHRPVIRIGDEERILPACDQYRATVERFADAARTRRCPDTEVVLAQARLVDHIRTTAHERKAARHA